MSKIFVVIEKCLDDKATDVWGCYWETLEDFDGGNKVVN